MFSFILFIGLLFLLFKFFIYPIFLEKHTNHFDLYVGVPGSGKTTVGAWFSKKYQSKKIDVYSNVNIKGDYVLSPKEDLGNYHIENALILIDECGLEYNNRDFKGFPKSSKYFFKYHRHYNCDIICLSQDLDEDKVIRKLATNIYLLKKSFFPYFIVRKTIKKKIDINKDGEIVDFYYFKFLGYKWFFAPKVWKMFNSVERIKLSEKVNWCKW